MPTGQVFIIPRRTDVFGMLFYVRDLFPNTSQRNLIYDPRGTNNADGQTHYLTYSIDALGPTTLAAGAYCCGSLNTDPIMDAVAEDTTGGGNDVLATPEAAYGLTAYLRERVQPGGTAAPLAGRMTPANAALQAQEIMTVADAGGQLDLAAINVILSDVGAGGTANTDLDGTASKSFGTVEDILRILTGETYKSSQDTIICNLANNFQSEAERDVFVAAQVTSVTGKTFVSKGYFVVPGEPGFRALPLYFRTGYFNVSNGEGWLAAHKLNITFKNPTFAYTAATVTPELPRAYGLDGNPIPSTGAYPVVVVYDLLGNVL